MSHQIACFLSLLLCGLCYGQTFGVEVPDNAPVGVKKAMERYEADVSKARDELLKALDKEGVAATKRGDLDAALAIRTLAESYAPAGASAAAKPSGLTAQAAKRLVAAAPKLSEAEWAELPGETYTLTASAGIQAIGLQVAQGETYVWVPHPTDRWDNVTWQGHANLSNYNNTDFNAMQVVWGIGGSLSGDLLISGAGAVTFQPNATNFANKVGSIRIKVLKVEK